MGMAMHGLFPSMIANTKMTGVNIEVDLAELIERIGRARDKAALAQLFGILAPKVKSTMLKRGASNAVAEDLVQETFLNVWRKAELYTPERGAVSTWIFTIARNLLIDHLRKQSSKPYEDLEGIELESDLPHGIHLIEQKEVVERVSRAIETLSADHREVVRLSFMSELPHAAIAKHIGIPLGTVKSRLRLAYDRLRPLLEDLH
jgi:RNA polymerase sigma-70 factor (ECF subfamily)